MITEILFALVTGVLVALINQYVRKIRFGGLKKVKIFEPQNNKINTKFYEYFFEQIDRAQDEIIVTGEGFEYKGNDGHILADTYHSKMLQALNRNVSITRIQTANPLHEKWANRLKSLVDDYPNKFHLYIVDNNEIQDIASVCGIDAGSKKNVVELMLSAENDIDDGPVRLASTGMFLHGRFELASAVRANALAMKKLSISKKCSSEKDIDKFINRPTELYFSFGSNMSEDQLLKRCPSAERVSIAMVPGYELVFNRKGSYRPGGVASITPSKKIDECVYGVIWKINLKDLENLDRLEDPNAYERITLKAVSASGETFTCYTYISFPQVKHLTPDPDYIDLIIDAAKAEELPKAYIEKLLKFKS